MLLADDASRLMPMLQLPALRRLSLSVTSAPLAAYEHASLAMRESLSRLTALSLYNVLPDFARALAASPEQPPAAEDRGQASQHECRVWPPAADWI